jgi:hypothetical protein
MFQFMVGSRVVHTITSLSGLSHNRSSVLPIL